jgi:hypothetical protein
MEEGSFRPEEESQTDLIGSSFFLRKVERLEEAFPAETEQLKFVQSLTNSIYDSIL